MTHQNNMKNPFITKKNTIYIDDKIIDINQSNIYKYFDKVFIIVKISDNDIMKDIHNEDINDNVYNNMKETLCIWQTSMNIIKNPLQMKKTIVVSKKILLLKERYVTKIFCESSYCYRNCYYFFIYHTRQKPPYCTPAWHTC